MVLVVEKQLLQSTGQNSVTFNAPPNCMVPHSVSVTPVQSCGSSCSAGQGVLTLLLPRFALLVLGPSRFPVSLVFGAAVGADAVAVNVVVGISVEVNVVVAAAAVVGVVVVVVVVVVVCVATSLQFH